MRIEDRLAVNKYDLDRETHITVDAEACSVPTVSNASTSTPVIPSLETFIT